MKTTSKKKQEEKKIAPIKKSKIAIAFENNISHGTIIDMKAVLK